jgi:hypothetical protein
VVRRGEESVEATVLASEPGRCRCEFQNGQKAWVLSQDIEGTTA